jgi:hypothetical protein
MRWIWIMVVAAWTLLAPQSTPRAEAQTRPVVSVATMAELRAKRPMTGETVEVRNYSDDILWSAPRRFQEFARTVVTNSHDGVHYVTNASPTSIYVSQDRFADQQDLRWFGGAPEDSLNDTAAAVAADRHAGGRLEVFFSPPIYQAPLISPGRYLLDAVTITTPGARWAGSSPASTSLTYPCAIVPWSTNFAVIAGNDVGVFSNRLNGFTLRNLTFSGEDNRTNGLWVNGGSYWGLIHNCAFLKFVGVGTLVGGNSNLPVSLIEFANCKWQNTDGLSTASLYVKQSSTYPTGFVTAINLHSCHLDEANADAGSYTMIIDSVGVTASGGTYFDLNNGGQGLRFDRSEAPYPTLSGSFVLDANSSGLAAEETYGFDTPRIGAMFPSGDYNIDGTVEVGGEVVAHTGRGWLQYRTKADNPFILGSLAIQDPTVSGGYNYSLNHRWYVNETDFIWTSTSRNLYALAAAGSVVARTLGNSNTIFSLDVQSTPTPTNAALRIGGGSGLYSYVTGQGAIGVGYANPVAEVAINGGLAVGFNADPGTGVAAASIGFEVPARGALSGSSTAPIRSINHTYTDLGTTAVAHQFSANANLTANDAGGLYNTYFTTRTGPGTNAVAGLFGVQSDLTIDGDFVLNARALGLQLNYGTTNNSGSIALARFSAPVYTSTGRPANLFAIYGDAITGGSALNYFIYSVGGSNYFGGSLNAAGGILLDGVLRTTWPSDAGTLDGQDGTWYLARSNHTGTQTISTLSDAGDFAGVDWPASDGQEYVAKNGAWAVATGGGGGGGGTTSVSVDAAGFATIINVQDSAKIGASLVGTNLAFSIVSGALDTNDIAAGTAAYFLARANHTGTQPISTLSDAGDLAGVDWPASDGQEYVAKNGAWAVATGGGGGGGSTTISNIMQRVGFAEWEVVTDGNTLVDDWKTTVQSVTVGGILTNVYAPSNATNGFRSGFPDTLTTRAVRLNIAASGGLSSEAVFVVTDRVLQTTNIVKSASTNSAYGETELSILYPDMVSTNLPLLVISDSGSGEVSLGSANPGIHLWTNRFRLDVFAVTNLAVSAAAGNTNLVSSSTNGLAPRATLANAYLGTDGSTSVGWKLGPHVGGSWTIVSNTTSEITVLDVTIPAGTLDSNGEGVDWSLSNIILNDSGLARTFTIKVLVNGTTVYQDTSDSLASSSTKRSFHIAGTLGRQSATLAQGSALFSIGAGTATTGIGDFGGAGLRVTTFAWEDAAATWASDVTFKVTYTLSIGSASYWIKAAGRVSH